MNKKLTVLFCVFVLLTGFTPKRFTNNNLGEQQ